MTIYSEYSVLPKLTRLDSYPPEGVFEHDEQYDHFINEKRAAWSDKLQSPINLAKQMKNSISSAISDRLRDWTNLDLPLSFLARKIQEDIAIHVVEPDTDYLGLTHICFPSDWLPEEKIGKSFAEIHSPVPGFKANRRIVEAMVNNGPFERWVWSVVYDPWEEQKINYHPSLPKKEFDLDNPYFHLKIERQTIFGFPELGAALFTMRQKLLPFEEIELDKLATACENMTIDERNYKGVEQHFVDWLNERVAQLD